MRSHRYCLFRNSNASENSLSAGDLPVESKAGFTLVEVMVASTLVALFWHRFLNSMRCASDL